MIDTEAIRNKVLLLALQGKLTEQLAEDGHAQTLYEEIQLEKQKLIQLGKLKKGKVLPKIAENEIPFSIPQTWKWIRWGELSESIQYGYNAPAKTEGRIKMVRISDIQDGKVMWDAVPYCDIDEEDIEQYLLHYNDILFARTGGTVGKSYIVSEIPNQAVFAGYLIRTSYSSKLCAQYMKYFMESSLYWKQLQSGTIATAQPNCNGNTLAKMIVPLPPYEEQVRIVDMLDKMYAILDTIDEHQSVYTLNVEILKSKLIDAGIQGKLTEQLSGDGTAEELYAAIQEEKAKLIKEKKVKKEKVLDEILEEEIPFEIPDNWKWVRLNSIGSWSAGATPSRGNKEYYTGNIPWVKTGELRNGSIRHTDEKISELALRECSVKLNPVGAVLIAMYGATIGKVGILEVEATTNQACCACVPYQGIYNKYLFYFLLAHKNDFIARSHGGAQPNISKEIIIRELFPLPPFAEQKRIVNRIEELLSII